MLDTDIRLFLGLCCVFFNAFFVLAEFALVRVRASRMQELSDRGVHRASLVLRMLSSIDEYLALCQIGITLMSLGLGWLVEPVIMSFIHKLMPELDASGTYSISQKLGVGLAFIGLSYIHIVVGELVPRAVGLRASEFVILRAAGTLYFLRRLFTPFLWLLNNGARLLLRLFGIKLGPRLEDTISEDELRLMLVESIGKGGLTDAKVDLIDNVFDFSKKTAKHVLISRDSIVSLDINAPVEESLAKAKANNHTRYPLCEGSIDQVIGLINFKDVLWESEKSRENMDLMKIRRDILFVPENKPLTKLLKDFQRNKIHMAIVIDEFGTTTGLVTLEDVLEELVGDIQDEYDQEAASIQLLRDGSYLIEGSTIIDDVEDKLNIKIEKADNTTIGGAVLSKLGRLPKIGDSADFESFKFMVKALKGRRISALQAIKKAREK